MKTLRQMLRQPLKYFAGVVLLTLAVAVLCVCLGQALAAKTTKEDLDRQFSTVAIPSVQEDISGFDIYRVEQELVDWLSQMASEHPDIVKGVLQHGFLSAGISEMAAYGDWAGTKILAQISTSMIQDGYSHWSQSGLNPDSHYDNAMLTFTLDEVFVTELTETHIHSGEDLRDCQFPTQEDYENYLKAHQWTTVSNGFAVKLKGTVTQVLSLQESWRDPVGSTLWLTLTVPTQASLDALALEAGEEYIAYGMDYYDDHKYFVALMSSKFRHVDFENFDPALLELPTEEEKERYKNNKNLDVVMLYDKVPLEQWQYECLNAVSMSMEIDGGIILYNVIRDENGVLQDVVAESDIEYTSADGEEHSIPREEYLQKFSVPTIAKLTGSVEEFLDSAAGAQWQETIGYDKVNNHGFAIIGVEEIDTVAAFALGRAEISEGREFTPEEVANGQRVCIVHQLVASNSGLKVGDTVTLSFYATDYSLPFQRQRTNGLDLLRPAASLYYKDNPILETAEYTIVGFWKGTAWPWTADNPYNYTANTVFVPDSSVQVPMELRNNITAVSVLLENGSINQFHDLARSAGYAGRFKYTDQDYSKIATNFHNYTDLAQQILTVGLVIYVMLMMLFLLLYPLARRKAVWTMQSLGCTYYQRFAHVLIASMSIVVPATALGGFVGYSLWERVVAALQTTAESSIALQLAPEALAQIAAAQLVMALIFNILVAVLVAAPRSIASRR